MADLLRGKPVNQAMDILRDLPKGSARSLLKLLQSAVANAKQKMSITEDKLKISAILVDMAPRLKRYKPRAMGKADTISKHASHIILILQSTLETKPEKKAKTEKPEKPVTVAAKKTDKHLSAAKHESK